MLLFGDENLYREVIEPIDEQAKKDLVYRELYALKINEMTEDCIQQFMTHHRIDWIKLIDFVSRKE